MKKFTLLSAIAALATVGSVFAAWTFNEGSTSINAEGSKNITVTVDKNVEITGGLTGTASLASTGEGTVKAGQKTANSGVVSFNESGDVADTYTISYVKGDMEVAANYETVVTITATGISGSTTTWTVTKDLTEGSATVTLDELLAEVNKTEISLGNDAAAVKTALATFDPSFSVSAVVKIK